MPPVKLIFYQEEQSCPVLEWLVSLPLRIQEKAEVRLERLAMLGHELRRPEADYLRDDIYELRWRFQKVNYRILYFFYGRGIIVLTHGMTKRDKISDKDMALAVRRKERFEQNPNAHAYEEDI